MTKKEILRAKDRVEKPSGINQLWQSDMTYSAPRNHYD